MNKMIYLLCLIAFLLASSAIMADDADIITSDIEDSSFIPLPQPVMSMKAENAVYDTGGVINVTWDISADDPENINGYNLYRTTGTGEYELIAKILPGQVSYDDDEAENELAYQYKIGTFNDGGETLSEPSNFAIATWEFFNFDQLNILIIAIFICGSVIGYILLIKGGRKLFIRKIGGLEALEEAVGRATEMGRPILFIPGIQDMDDVQTIAGITILGRVARVVADYDSKIRMPVSRSLVMTSARETIKEAYMSAGRPDGYSDDMVQYITDEQFGYVAAVNGIMVREKPATCLYLGAFFAESLILAETGNSIGAIQIAGTARPGQLPFFVAACDYTLIGEELFAASAYLSGDPKQLGSLRGQDVGKILAMCSMILGTFSATFVAIWDKEYIHKILEILHKIFATN